MHKKIKTILNAALSVSGLFLLTTLTASADWAPAAVSVGDRFVYNSKYMQEEVTVLSATVATEGWDNYTYTYKKTGANTARLTYKGWTGSDESLLTFTAEGALSFVSKKNGREVDRGVAMLLKTGAVAPSAPVSLTVGDQYELYGDSYTSSDYYYGAGAVKSASVLTALNGGRSVEINYVYTKTGSSTATITYSGLPDSDEARLTFATAGGAYCDLYKRGSLVSRGVFILKKSAPVGQDEDNTLTVSKQTLGALSTKGVKLSAPAALVVPKGTKLFKGAKAVYTWKRDGTVVGTGKTLTVKQSGEYAVTLSYKRADGGTTNTTAVIASVTIYAAPKITSLTVSQTTDTITSGALKNTSVVSGEALSLTVSIEQTAGAQFGPFNYKWYRGAALVKTQQSAAASDTFVTPAYGDKADAYKVEVETVARDPKNSAKPLAVAKSKAFKAKVILPPSAVTLKLSANPVKEGKPLTLSASAKGTAALTFTWYKNGQQIATGSAKKFTKKPVTVSDAGTYYVVVSQDKTNRRAQSAPLTVSVQRADGSIVSGALAQSALSAALSPAADQRRQDAADTLPGNSVVSVLNLAPLKLSPGDALTLSGSATREYIIVNETQHTTGAYRYEWRDNLTAEFQDADDDAHLTLRFITIDSGVYELSISGSVNETGVFELRKK